MNQHKILFTFTLLFIFQLTNAQLGGLNYDDEVEKMVQIPSTPEASAFDTYGDTSVNLHQGTPDITVPIGQVSGREMNLPLNLYYDATGIKVEAQASWVGMNWNLNGVGRVTRVINGQVDQTTAGTIAGTLYEPAVRDKVEEYNIQNRMFDSEQEVQDYFAFLGDINKNYIDAQPDLFKVNAFGLNETFVIDFFDGNTPKALDNPRNKVTGSENSGWVVTTEDGTSYHFMLPQRTDKVTDNAGQPGGQVFQEYYSSYLLTKIVSPNGKDTFTFDYAELGLWQDFYIGHPSSYVVNKINADGSYGGPNLSNSVPNYKLDQSYIDQIKHNGVLAVDFILTNDRQDGESKSRRLDRIDIFDHTNTADNDIIRSYDFEHSYFGDLSSQDFFDKRLKLDEVRYKDALDSEVYKYSFEYNYNALTDIPSRQSRAIDIHGLYNGANSNQVLYPSYGTLSGADRSSNFESSIKGILKKITYPTGGYSTFEYEPHTISKFTGNTVTETYVYPGIDNNSQTQPGLYRDNGVLCDDAYLPGDPKIKILNFDLPESDNYDIVYAHNPSYREAAIVYLGNVDVFNCQTTNGVQVCETSGSHAPELQNYCDFYNTNKVWHSTFSNQDNIFLEKGKYQVMLLYDDNSVCVLAGTCPPDNSIAVRRDVYTTQKQNITVGGIRIKNIRHYENANNLASIKKVEYDDDNGFSTGILNYPIQLTALKTIQANGYNPAYSEVHRSSSIINGDQPLVVYRRVKEFTGSDIPLQVTPLGYTEYVYDTTIKGGYPSLSPPHAMSYFQSVSSGQPKNVSVLNSNNNILSSMTNEYFQATTVAGVQGIAVRKEASLQGKRLVITETVTPSGTTYGYTHMDIPPCDSGSWCATPCDDNTCLDPQYTFLSSTKTIASGAFGGPSLQNTSQYYYDANGILIDTVETTNETVYDDVINFLPRYTEMTDSKGDVYKTEMYYPKDLVTEGSGDLVAKNRVSEKVKTVSLKNGDTLAVVRNGYRLWPNSKAMQEMLINTKKGTEDEEPRIFYNFYNDGNIKETYQVLDHELPSGGGLVVVNTAFGDLALGTPTTYIWGYNSEKLIAKIDNASYGDVQAYIGGLQLAANNDDDRTIGMAGNEGALRQELETFRLAFPNAIVTTFTHDPGIGVTSVTDPKGYTIYYDYDAFNRLKEVRDAEGNLMSENEYNYRAN